MGVGAHLGHEAEPFPPANTVLLNLLPAGGDKNRPEISLVLPLNYLPEGLLKHFPLALQNCYF